MPASPGVVPPIVVSSEDGLALFDSVGGLRGYVEVPDVETGVYGPAFDAEGRLLAIELPEPLFEAPPESFFRRLSWRLLGASFNSVAVRVLEDQPTHQDELKRLLAAKLGIDDQHADLPELLETAKQRYGIDT